MWRRALQLSTLGWPTLRAAVFQLLIMLKLSTGVGGQVHVMYVIHIHTYVVHKVRIDTVEK